MNVFVGVGVGFKVQLKRSLESAGVGCHVIKMISSDESASLYSWNKTSIPMEPKSPISILPIWLGRAGNIRVFRRASPLRFGSKAIKTSEDTDPIGPIHTFDVRSLNRPL